MEALRNFGVLFVRNVKGSLRNPVWLFIGMFQPVLYLLLFAPLLKGLNGVPGFPPGGAYSVFTPGLLVMLALFTSAFAGFGLVDHIRAGFVERLLVTPASRLSILSAYLARDVVVLLVQSTIAVLLALLLGLTVSLAGLLITFGLMVLTGALMASCSYALAMVFKQEDTLASITNTVATPLLLLSGITLPLTLAPRIIRALASVNPLAYEVTAARSLFLGNFSDPSLAVAFVTLGALTALAFWWAVRSFKRAAA
ncbi:MAG TPA: ABC transporter permease [Spirochaetia bacterium]|nr:ABC transporter permease [Spirochaetia bacterium]